MLSQPLDEGATFYLSPASTKGFILMGDRRANLAEGKR